MSGVKVNPNGGVIVAKSKSDLFMKLYRTKNRSTTSVYKTLKQIEDNASKFTKHHQEEHQYTKL